MTHIALALILASLPLATGAQVPTAPFTPAAAQSIPVVGTFDRASIVLASYRSPQWAAILADKQYERDAAKSANDDARVKELEKWGKVRQDLAMQQIAGKAPIVNILEVLQPEMKRIAREMKLSGIVESPGPGPKAATVDVTSLLMDWLKASQQTRKEAADLQKRPGGK